jgi:hypothetical protein
VVETLESRTLLTAAVNGPAVLGDRADALWDVLH